MAEKTLNTRIQQKHDIEANWLKAVNFIPKVGEVIVYDIDETHTTPRMKIGDGVKNINELEFIGEKAAAPDWNASEGEPGYIENRTHYAIREQILFAGCTDYPALTSKPPYANKPIAVIHPPSYVVPSFDEPITFEMDGVSTSTNLIAYAEDKYYCGNFSAFNGDMPDTGENFCIYFAQNQDLTWRLRIAVFCESEGTVSISCKCYGTVVEYVPLSINYIPNNNIRNGNGSSAFMIGNTVASDGAFAIGTDTTASGPNAFASGESTIAEGYCSSAFGIGNRAHGKGAHVEGSGTVATGNYSHAEGINSSTSGKYSHAEGGANHAVGDWSHVEGSNNVAYAPNSHVEGILSKLDTELKYVHIVGNGAIDEETGEQNRSNAHTLDWSGNGWFAGGLKVGGTGQDDTAAVSVLTENDMTAITNAEIDVLFQ